MLCPGVIQTCSNATSAIKSNQVITCSQGELSMEALSKVRAHGSSSLMCVWCMPSSSAGLRSGAVQLQVQCSLPLKAVQLFKAFTWTSEDLRQKRVLLLLSVLCLVLSWLSLLTLESYFPVQFLSPTGELSHFLTWLAKKKKKKIACKGAAY